MLQLILGIAGTGKTTALLDEVSRRAGEKKDSILLVPEQFSSSAEAMVYEKLGDAGTSHVEVLSFRTMAERILKMCGGWNIRILSDAGRAVFVRQALHNVSGSLHAFARHRRSAAFYNACAESIRELKTAGATPDILRKTGQQAGDEKITELAAIFEAYEECIRGTVMDPTDRLSLAAGKADCGFFAGKACVIDDFDGFTAPEYKLLKQVLLHCEQASITLCCDVLEETDGGVGRFSPVRRTGGNLLRFAGETGKEAKILVLRDIRRPAAKGILAVNGLLAEKKMEEGELSSEGVRLTCARDEWEEAELAAAAMHKLALQGVPYSKMTLVCRNIEQYEGPVRRQLGLFDIPYFVDAPATIEYSAPVAFLRAGVALLRQGLTSQPVLALLKTGLCSYTEGEIAHLENYVYTWAPKAEDWRTPFEKNPAGLLAALDETNRHKLEAAEKVRNETVPLLEAFLRYARGKGSAQVAKQLYLLLEAFHAGEHCEAIAQSFETAGDIVRAEEVRRAWDIAMDLLDQMALLLGEEKLSPDEFDALFLILVRSTDFGRVPQSLECAVFTSADRMRLASPEYCFVLGLAEGDFPMQVGYSGLLTHADRARLVQNGVEMPGSFENRVLLEEMFFYRALTAAKSGLYLSWPQRRAGAPKAMSAAVEPLLVLHAPALQPGFLEKAATPGAAFALLGGLYRQNMPEAASLYAALRESGGGAKQALGLLRTVENEGQFTAGDEKAIRRLLGESMALSATRAEKYYACPFSFYMERVLNIKPRRKAEFSPLESGTFVHYVLEQVLREAGEAFAGYTDEKLAETAQRHADGFIAQNLPAENRRSEFLLGRVKKSTARLLCYMRDAVAHSDFAIDALELSIGKEEGGIPPLEVTGADGQTIRVQGKIDRVDMLQKGGKSYLCIVDYKTGDKKFSLADVYCGLNMQMLLYMDALCKNAVGRYPNPVPAGILYLTGDPRPQSGRKGEEAAPVFKMDGLLLDDPGILRAMDHDGSGVFLPVKYNKDGSPRAGKQLAGLEKMGAIAAHVEGLIAEMAQNVYRGQFPARPLVKGESRPCQWCAYRAACRHEDGRGETQVEAPDDAFETENSTSAKEAGAYGG